MNQTDLLNYVVDVCNRLRLRYFVTGSMASMGYGEWRVTHDIDVVIDFRYGDIQPFYDAFSPESFYFDRNSMVEAIRSAPSQFNIIHPESGLKVDVMIPELSNFDQSRFERVQEERRSDGGVMRLASPEDIILKKLVYYEEGHSEKHIRDITSMLRVQGDAIDRGYIEHWAPRLGVIDAWRMIVAKVDRAEGK